MADTLRILDWDEKHARAIEIARSFDGLCVSDAIAILDNARYYLLHASQAATARIPAKEAK